MIILIQHVFQFLIHQLSKLMHKITPYQKTGPHLVRCLPSLPPLYPPRDAMAWRTPLQRWLGWEARDTKSGSWWHRSEKDQVYLGRSWPWSWSWSSFWQTELLALQFASFNLIILNPQMGMSPLNKKPLTEFRMDSTKSNAEKKHPSHNSFMDDVNQYDCFAGFKCPTSANCLTIWVFLKTMLPHKMNRKLLRPRKTYRGFCYLVSDFFGSISTAKKTHIPWLNCLSQGTKYIWCQVVLGFHQEPTIDCCHWWSCHL